MFMHSKFKVKNENNKTRSNFGFLIFMAVQVQFDDYYVIASFVGISLLYIFYVSVRNAAYEITEVNFTKESFVIEYFEESVKKKIDSNVNKELQIVFTRQHRGIFPFNDKKRVEFIEIKNEHGKTLIKQYVSSNWKSTELHELFYDGLEKYYNWYWRDKVEFSIVKNN